MSIEAKNLSPPCGVSTIDLAALIQMDPQRFGITGRLSLAYHR